VGEGGRPVRALGTYQMREDKHGQGLLYLRGEFSRLTRTASQAVTCHGP
jgi:hypothetical protein